MAHTVPQLLKMSQAQLDELFKKSSAGKIPNGAADGTAIVAPGTKYSKEVARFINNFGWQGKVFDAKKGVLGNLRADLSTGCCKGSDSTTSSRHWPIACCWKPRP